MLFGKENSKQKWRDRSLIAGRKMPYLATIYVFMPTLTRPSQFRDLFVMYFERFIKPRKCMHLLSNYVFYEYKNG